MLDAILKKAFSGKHIRLAKGTDKTLMKVKEIGDAAAHNRYYITKKQDIEEFRAGFRRVVSELLTLGGIVPQTAPRTTGADDPFRWLGMGGGPPSGQAT
jgi:hypothetical protein